MLRISSVQSQVQKVGGKSYSNEVYIKENTLTGPILCHNGFLKTITEDRVEVNRTLSTRKQYISQVNLDLQCNI